MKAALGQPFLFRILPFSLLHYSPCALHSALYFPLSFPQAQGDPNSQAPKESRAQDPRLRIFRFPDFYHLKYPIYILTSILHVPLAESNSQDFA